MSNSPLVVYTKLSPNNSGKRTHAIDRITPHCVVGQASVESVCALFANSARQASSNYVIGYDGKIALSVDEGNRSWCSSSNANDQRAVTIECASDKSAPYAFNSTVYNRLIDLCVDICKRNGKSKLIWFGDKNKTLNYNPAANEMILTVHRWFSATSCPGDWMYSRMGDLAKAVTAKLSGAANGQSGTQSGAKFPATPFLVNVIIDDLNYRSEPSMSGAVKGQTGKGAFTIVEVKNGWGKLKSGAGWIYLENPAYCTIGGAATSKPAKKPEPAKKSVDEIAKEVIQGKWGNGAERKKKLTAAGYDYGAVQKRVDALMKK